VQEELEGVVAAVDVVLSLSASSEQLEEPLPLATVVSVEVVEEEVVVET